MSASKSAPSHGSLLLRLLVAVAIGVLVAGNVHLVYVALSTEPPCVPHVRDGDAQPGPLRAARSSCRPQAAPIKLNRSPAALEPTK